MSWPDFLSPQPPSLSNMVLTTVVGVATIAVLAYLYSYSEIQLKKKRGERVTETPLQLTLDLLRSIGRSLTIVTLLCTSMILFLISTVTLSAVLSDWNAFMNILTNQTTSVPFAILMMVGLASMYAVIRFAPVFKYGLLVYLSVFRRRKSSESAGTKQFVKTIFGVVLAGVFLMEILITAINVVMTMNMIAIATLFVPLSLVLYKVIKADDKNGEKLVEKIIS